MKEYDTITLEELRCTDYMANHGFGEPTSAFGQTPGGWTAATTQQSALFGANQKTSCSDIENNVTVLVWILDN